MEDEKHQGGIDVSWPKITSELKKSLDKDTFQNWIKPIYFESLIDTSLTLSVPTRFLRDWIIKNYASVIKKAYMDQGHSIDKLAILVKENNNRIIPGTEVIYEDKDDDEDTYYDDISAPLDPKFTFDNFIVGKPNELAYAAAQRVAQSEVVSFNPLFLYGGVGLGKTHLAHAIGVDIKQKYPDKTVLYISAEKFTQQYVDSVKKNTRNDFIHFYQLIDILIVDDVQFLSGKSGTQDVFFHIFNHLHQNGKQVILTSDKAPIDMQDIEQRLLSRFKWGLSAELQNPNFETRVSILKNKLYRDGVEIQDEVIEFVAKNINSNVRELEGAIISLIAQSSFNKAEITVDLAKEVINKFVKNNRREVSIDYIQKVVSDYFQMDIQTLQSKTRKRHIVQARQIAMYFAKKFTKASLASIGSQIGRRDHATVLHACKTVDNLSFTDKQFRKYVEDLNQKLSN